MICSIGSERLVSKLIVDMRRHKLVSEIFKHAEVIGTNKSTVVFILATMNDRELTRFHKEFLQNKPLYDR